MCTLGCSALCDIADLVPALLGSERLPQKIYLELVFFPPPVMGSAVAVRYIVHIHTMTPPVAALLDPPVPM